MSTVRKTVLLSWILSFIFMPLLCFLATPFIAISYILYKAFNINFFKKVALVIAYGVGSLSLLVTAFSLLGSIF